MTVRSSGSISSASRQPPGGSGWRRKASVSPTARSWLGLALHAPGDALDRAEEVDQHRHVGSAAAAPTTFSNSTAGPPSASRRVWISVISRTGETGALTRTRSPAASSRS